MGEQLRLKHKELLSVFETLELIEAAELIAYREQLGIEEDALIRRITKLLCGNDSFVNMLSIGHILAVEIGSRAIYSPPF